MASKCGVLINKLQEYIIVSTFKSFRELDLENKDVFNLLHLNKTLKICKTASILDNFPKLVTRNKDKNVFREHVLLLRRRVLSLSFSYYNIP